MPPGWVYISFPESSAHSKGWRAGPGQCALAELDLVIGSVHSHMSMEPAEMTDRLLRAMECPYMRVMGHPTGRMLLHRDPFPFDFERVVTEAGRRGIWMEVNASPERLDLGSQLIRIAKSKGVRFTISTDAHHPEASLQHAVRHYHCKAGLARPVGRDEHATRHGLPKRHSQDLNK